MEDVTRMRRDIGRRIVRAREAQELSIESARTLVGEDVGETPSRFTWMRWESGRGPLPAEMVAPIARLLGVEPGWLLTGRTTGRTTSRSTSRPAAAA